MKEKNATNFIFLEKVKPDLFKLAIKMEEELLVTPVSMFTYSTRFLEFILHDVADENNFEFDTKAGFVDKVNQLKRSNYLNDALHNNLPQLMIDAYKLRSDTIHNHHIEESLKDDKKIAFILNETLFYIADAYYKKLKGNDEEHVYVEPKLIIESKEDPILTKPDSLNYGQVSYSKPKTIKRSNVKKDETIPKKHIYAEHESIKKHSVVKKPKDITKQNSQDFDENEIKKFLKLLENGYSQKTALRHVDINQTILNNWYITKKSEFIGGDKDSLFIKYNELLIENTIKSIIEDRGLGNNSQKVDFWLQYFEEFIDEHSKNLTGNQLNVFKLVFKKYAPKKDKQNTDDEQAYENISVKLPSIDKKELEKREELMLENIDKYNFKVSLKKSKLRTADVQRSKKEFLNGKRNNFYHKLSKKLMNKYLGFRKDGKSTNAFCNKMAFDRYEVDFWIREDAFKDFHIRYNRIRINLFKKAMINNKSQKGVLNDLEMNQDQFNDFIQLIINDDEYSDVKHIIRQYYPSYSLYVFMNEFRKNPNIDEALKKSNLTNKDLKMQFRSNKMLYDEYRALRVNHIEKNKINNEKVNLDNLDMSQEEYSKVEDEIDERVEDKQIGELTNGLSGGMLLVTASNMGLDIDTVFDWILKGSIDNNKYSNFANRYWETHVGYINSLNSTGESYGLKTSQNNLEIISLKTHRGYWKKWGLIDKNNVKFTVEDIKQILRK